MIPESGTLALDHDAGGALAYDLILPSDGSGRGANLLVLINGFQRNRQDFRALRKRLHSMCPTLATVALDNRGVGDTVTTQDFSMRDMAQDVMNLVTTFQERLRPSAIFLLGISMGGMIAQLATSALLERGEALVKGLVLVSTTAGGALRVRSPNAIYRPHDPQQNDFESHKRMMTAYFGPRFRKSSPLLIDAMAKNVFKARGDAHSNNRPAVQFAASRDFDGAEALARMRAARLKTLVLCGVEDEIMPLKNSESLHAALGDTSRLVTYPEVGHLLLIEEPEGFASIVAEFVSLPS